MYIEVTKLSQALTHYTRRGPQVPPQAMALVHRSCHKLFVVDCVVAVIRIARCMGRVSVLDSSLTVVAKRPHASLASGSRHALRTTIYTIVPFVPPVSSLDFDFQYE